MNRIARALSVVTIAAVVSLALGIGATSAIFTLVNSVLLRPLAVERPHELATLSTVSATKNQRTEMFSYATFEDIRRRDLFDGVFTWTLSSLAIEGEAQPVSAMWMSGEAFRVLGVRATIGRTLLPSGGVLRLVLMQTLRLTGAGVLVGAVLSLWSGRVVASMLYGVAPQEPFIVAGAAALLLGTGIIAACAPAYRASLTDPAAVLRND